MHQRSLTSLAYALVLASSVYASPRVLDLDFTVAIREAPATGLVARATDKTTEVQLNNLKLIYLLNVSVGTPPQPLQVQIDTGSADLWLPQAGGALCTVDDSSCPQTGSFDPEKSSSAKPINTTHPFQTSYADNSQYKGIYVSDKVTVGSATLNNARFGLVDEATHVVSNPGVPKSNGIMGVGFNTLEAGTKFFNDTPYPNFVQELKRQNVIDTLAYSIWFNNKDASTGSILFGGIDTAKFDGPLINLPIVTDIGKQVADEMVVEFTSLAAKDKSGTKDLGVSTTYPALIDSGNSGLSAPGFIVKAIMDYTGAVLDGALTGSAAVPCNLSTAEASIVFGFGGKGGPQISVPIADFVTPGASPIFFKDGTPACVLGITEAPDAKITLGAPFLRQAYAVFNLEKKTIAFAQAKPNPSGSNIQAIKDGVVSAIPTALPSLTVAAASTAPPMTAASTGSPDSPTLAVNPGKASVTAERAAGTSSPAQSNTARSLSVSELGYLPVMIMGATSVLAAVGGLLVC